MFDGQTITHADKPSETKGNGFVAFILSFVVPGLGHAYRGRWGKAVLWFAVIMFVDLVAALSLVGAPSIVLWHLCCALSAAKS